MVLRLDGLLQKILNGTILACRHQRQIKNKDSFKRLKNDSWACRDIKLSMVMTVAEKPVQFAPTLLSINENILHDVVLLLNTDAGSYLIQNAVLIKLW